MTEKITRIRPGGPKNQEEQELHLSDYLHIILNRKKVVLIFLGITVALTAVFTYAEQPVYQAESKIIIGADSNVSPISGQAFAVESYYSEEKNFNTHFKLITSKPVLRLVAEEIDLAEDFTRQDLASKNFLSRNIIRIKNKISWLKQRAGLFIKRFLPASPSKRIKTSEEIQSEKYAQLMSRIKVTPVESTRIMEICVMDSDPVRTSRIANAVAQKYIEFDRSVKLKSSTDKLKWMTDELYRLKARLEDSEKEFISYKQDQKMFSMEGKQTAINQKIASFNQKYLEARNKKLELDIKLKDLESALGNDNNIMQIKPMVTEPMIKDLYSRLTTLEIEKEQLLKVYKSKHPKLVQVESMIDNTSAKLKMELEKKLSSIKRERNILSDQETALKDQIAAFENEAMATSEKELAYNIHQRNVNTSQQIYDILLAQIKESNILQSGDTSNLTIVETADIPEKPVKPDKQRNFILSLVFGLFGGIGLCFLFEYLDQTIQNKEGVEDFLGYPVLAIVPDAKDPDAASGGN